MAGWLRLCLLLLLSFLFLLQLPDIQSLFVGHSGFDGWRLSGLLLF